MEHEKLLKQVEEMMSEASNGDVEGYFSPSIAYMTFLHNKVAPAYIELVADNKRLKKTNSMLSNEIHAPMMEY